MFSTALLIVAIGMVAGQPPIPAASCFQPSPVTADSCCKMPKLVDSAVMDKCRSENPRNGPPPAPGTPRTEGCCVAQCVLTSIGGFSNDTLNTDILKKSLSTTVGKDANFASALNGFVDDCARQIQSNPAYKVAPVSSKPGSPGCSFIPEGFSNCLSSTMFKACPAAAWTESSNCQELKQKLDSGCPFMTLLAKM